MRADDKTQTADSLQGLSIEMFMLALYAEERTTAEQIAHSPLLHGESKQRNSIFPCNIDGQLTQLTSIQELSM
jgi:hypothetical protein